MRSVINLERMVEDGSWAMAGLHLTRKGVNGQDNGRDPYSTVLRMAGKPCCSGSWRSQSRVAGTLGSVCALGSLRAAARVVGILFGRRETCPVRFLGEWGSGGSAFKATVVLAGSLSGGCEACSSL